LNQSEENDDQLITLGAAQFVKFSPTDGSPYIYEVALTVWPALTNLAFGSPLVRFLERNVKGVDLDKDDVDEAAKTRKTSFRNFRRGLVWFPLARWRECAAIKARNQDVMQWVESTLEALMASAGTKELPDWLLLGSGTELHPGVDKVQIYGFGDGRPTRDAPPKDIGTVPLSLVDGLDQVRTHSGSVIYRGQEIRHGLLRPERLGHRIGIVVSVLSADGVEENVGYLRPVQRYVLNQGLRRAKDLRETAIATVALGRDIVDLGSSRDFGYIRAWLTGGRVIAVLPLIVEQIGKADEEGCASDSHGEFVLCDGNHRLVQYLLMDRHEAMGCAVILGEPKEPYYGWPYSRWDWGIVFQNRLDATPDLYAKYTPRYPDDCKIEDIRRNPDIYRRFFRDLATGFGDIGTQGGRLA
jgi:hypothetical protein